MVMSLTVYHYIPVFGAVGKPRNEMPPAKPQPLSVETPRENEAEYEQQHVHNVYQVIAPHFSETRYKPWPVVENFLNSVAVGHIGADVGCGNGKYIGINKNVWMIGSDRSSNLIDIVRQRGFEGMVCDALRLPYRDACFDFGISIAVIHHFSTPERRLLAIKELLRILRPGAPLLIFVWAMEQTGTSKRRFEDGRQDVFVPWILPTHKARPAASDGDQREKRRGPEEGEGVRAEMRAEVGAGAEAGARARAGAKGKTVETREMKGGESSETGAIRGMADIGEGTEDAVESSKDVVYQRYYHLFAKNELDDLVVTTGEAEIVQTGYDRDNWYVIACKRQMQATSG